MRILMPDVVIYAYNCKYLTLRQEDFTLEGILVYSRDSSSHKENRKTETSVQADYTAAVHLKCLGTLCLLGNLRNLFLFQSQTHVY